MKTLIIVAHPEIENSQTQEFLYQGAQAMNVEWHHLDAIAQLNVEAEQQLLRTADRIIFQFPLYWYAAPASLKDWEDTVLTRNFIYGDGRFPLANKELGIVVTTGRPLKDFRHGGTENITIDEMLASLRAVGHLAQMKILPAMPIAQFSYQQEAEQMQLLIDYQRYLTQPAPDSLANRETWFANQLPKFIAKLPAADQFTGQLIADTFAQNQADLEQLRDALNLLKEGEED
ncbi:NADPH-quinone reductase (modulator of drug activity B) [Lentilactobacillus senioris DSM 24302 = JCM 17472]|uniref:NADPH-quinone reductase (Modulator of drug activity B) n=1 Tax=Lentilactobacillus senioris DSM 24302 = JCM 17472 TaxID=1423802 RepID=A0A0R2CRD3_9LACO|nr:NAD(P)H-dependent oxidoreductase [Lentilactobacillus senioris]KRM94367.1 NADPH-quinone reductase (modulator of drug activity B) [Lentilactobacillus senioris DSM 24302 = JCM 17472]